MLAAEVVRVHDRFDASLQAESLHFSTLHVGRAIGEQAESVLRCHRRQQSIRVVEQDQIRLVQPISSDELVDPRRVVCDIEFRQDAVEDRATDAGLESLPADGKQLVGRPMHCCGQRLCRRAKAPTSELAFGIQRVVEIKQHGGAGHPANWGCPRDSLRGHTPPPRNGTCKTRPRSLPRTARPTAPEPCE
ncbi:MAG: hypothetical protein FD138_390 [Planctomycetota bacterium]|nr:MAG: hypothetical protein FD138_390 [Planctomycetota bacterium]